MILSDNETKLDLLNNQAIAKTIVSIIRDSKESVSIGVHGDWGAGKSSILVMVEDLLNPKRSEDDTDPEDSDEDDFDWDEMEAVVQEMKFKKTDGKTEYKYDDYAELVYDLGNQGYDIPDLTDEWIEYEEDMKSYGDDNGSGWSPSW